MRVLSKSTKTLYVRIACVEVARDAPSKSRAFRREGEAPDVRQAVYKEEEIARKPIGIALECLVILAALATVPFTFSRELGIGERVASTGDWAIWWIFFVEFVVMMALVDDRAGYAKRSWLNIAVVVLTYPGLPDLLATIGIVRLTRIARLFRVMRFLVVATVALRSLRNVLGRSGLVYVGALNLCVIFLGAALITFFEPETVKGNLGNGLWWSLVTASTVGYGDISPSTTGGRLIAAMLMLSGIGLISTLSASISAYFVGHDETLNQRLDVIDERMKSMEKLLAGMAGAPEKGGGDSERSPE